jgi:hypothetical protein
MMVVMVVALPLSGDVCQRVHHRQPSTVHLITNK